MNRNCSTGKEVVSTDTKVETKTVPFGNSVQHITITTTKQSYADGSSSTKTATRTVTERIVEVRASGSSAIKIIQNEIPVTKAFETPHVKHSSQENSSSSESSSDSSDDDDNNVVRSNVRPRYFTSKIDFVEGHVVLEIVALEVMTFGLKVWFVLKFSAFQRQALQAHNAYRAKHGAKPLTLSKKICETSQKWANTLAVKGRLEHNSGTGYGENIYWNSGEIKTGNVPVDSWYKEAKNFKFNRNEFQPNTGHFSQVVWKETTELGIAKAAGNSGTFVVANYNPPGNYEGHYLQNVGPLI